MKPSFGRWAFAVLVVAAGALFAWWVLHPIPARHAPRRVARTASGARPAPTHSVTIAPPSTPLPPSPVPALARGARLAIIIDDAGQWLKTERALIALPVPLTFAVLPGVRYTKLVSQEAAAAGKGVMLHLPMEPISHLNPGPGKITTTMSDAQIVAQVDSDLADVPLAQGVNNHEGSAATADARVMRAVAGALAAHGHLFFVDSLTIGDSVAAKETRADGIPTGERDVFLDDVNAVPYVEAQLLQAAAIARRDGRAIAIGHPRPATLAALRALIPRLRATGIQFVLVSQLLDSAVQPPPASPGRIQ
jgi:polysaccharide deacetylase 2 family uncharacterized protein YibQ